MKSIIAAILVLFCAISVNAQKKVEYYQFIKKIDANGSVTTQSSHSGQFIIFDGQKCYDGNKNGESVGNGVLNKVVTSSQATKYMGNAYWGQQVTYTFYHGEGILNVRDLRDNVYVYKKSSPPKGVYTSSLIKNKSSYNSDGYYPSQQQNYNSSGNSENNNNSWNKTRPCRKCNGRRVCTTCNGTGQVFSRMYGVDKYITCPACGNSKKCSLCGGSGEEHYIAP